MNKVSIFGAGRVGESTAQFIAIRELAREVCLVDIREGAAAGAALDIQESSTLFDFDVTLSGDTDPNAVEDSDLVVITAGLPRKPGMSRSDVLEANLSVINPLVDAVAKRAPDAMILMVTNPVDVLTYFAWQRSGFERHRVFGLSGVLDAGRMAAFVAMETGYSAKDVTAMVLGGHGDAMVPLSRFTCVNGISIEHLMDQKAIDRIVKRTRQGGAEILALKQTSSAYDAPAAAIAEMVDAISGERHRILPCVSILDGEYGERDIAAGVPAVVGRGIERVLELPLTDHEKKQFSHSIASVREDINRIKQNSVA